jgi:toxin ParE1/3/4
LDKYEVKLYARAYRDMEDIYAYIANNLHDPNAAQNIIDEIENAVFSLELMPERGAVRRSGIYANRDYRQLFVGNYIIVYRVKKEEKQVHIVTVRYAPSSF